jgi:hypothetical protein
MSGEEEENAAELKIGDGTSTPPSQPPCYLGFTYYSPPAEIRP